MAIKPTHIFKSLVAGSLIIMLQCCNSYTTLEKQELIRWVENENNLLTKHQTENELDYQITYCPLDYLICKEVQSDVIKKTNFEKRKQDLVGFEYFKLRIKLKNSNQEVLMYGLNHEQDYLERINYLSYGFEENICLIRNNFQDTIFPSLYHFERTYGVVPYADFVFSFKSDSTLKSINNKLLINDVVFGNGNLLYDFDHLKQLKIPSLNLY